jgi:Ca-activated chloride channel family protein
MEFVLRVSGEIAAPEAAHQPSGSAPAADFRGQASAWPFEDAIAQRRSPIRREGATGRTRSRECGRLSMDAGHRPTAGGGAAAGDATMDFIWPTMLLGLLALPALVLIYLRAQRRRPHYARAFRNPALLRDVATAVPTRLRHIAPACFLLGLGALLVALARPELVIPVPTEQSTVMLVIDTSRSMEATDVQPTRLAAAKVAAKKFLGEVPSQARVGVVGFTGIATIVVAPTEDHLAVARGIDSLYGGSGTAIGDGLLTGLGRPPRPTSPAGRVAGAGPAPSGAPLAPASAPVFDPPDVIVLLSDGASNRGVPPAEAALVAKDMNVKVYTIGVGTAGGPRSVRGPGGNSDLDERTLRGIADVTQGQYFNASSAEDLSAIYESLGSKVGWEEQKTEITFLVAGAALLASLAGAVLSLLHFQQLP